MESITQSIEVSIVDTSRNHNPFYATEDSAGLDLMANLEEPIVINPLQRVLVPTGIKIALPKGTEAQIRSRSGLAYKNGIIVLNAPGTIDADYRGEVKVLLINLSDTPFTIENGDRIAQMVIANYIKVKLVNSLLLPEAVRGEGGFGSTGTK